MSLIKRSTSKRDQARRAVSKSTRSARKQARSSGIGKAAGRLVPKRVGVAIGGAVAAVAGLLAVRKRKGSDSEPS